MIVVQLIANSVLQQLVQPLAMGAALGIHPLAVLVVTSRSRHLVHTRPRHHDHEDLRLDEPPLGSALIVLRHV